MVSEHAKIGVCGEEQVHAAVRCKPFPRLREQHQDVSVVRTCVPSAVGQVARFAREGGRARQDHVKQLARRNGREEV